MSNTQEALRSVAVFGGGLVALSAAIGFARALPRATVTLVLTPLDPAALADRLPALPRNARPTLARLGLDFASLTADAGAVPRVAERFVDWDAASTDWTRAAGDGPPSIDAGAFHQAWLEARRRNAAAAFETYVPDIGVALAERFPDNDDIALRLDAGVAGAVWFDQLERAGVRVIRDGVPGHTVGAKTVMLASGAQLVADLFVDATGPASLLAGRGDWIDWGDALPVDRLLLLAQAPCPAPLDTYRATASGWHSSWPLRRMTLRGSGFAAGVTTERRARRAFGVGGDEAQLLTLRCGRRGTLWNNNVLTLGDAAVAAGPLGWPGLGLALAQLHLALDLLPGRSLDPLLLAEFNRRAGLRADRMRDFLAAHYLPQRPRNGEFWNPLRGRALPPALGETLRQFARRGAIPHFEEESVTKADWIALLLGLGYGPTQRDPIAMGADPETTDAALERLKASIVEHASALPFYRDHLAQLPRGPA